MKKLHNFKCESGNTFERFVADGINKVKCNCGGGAIKQLSAPRYFSNTTGKSPSR